MNTQERPMMIDLYDYQKEAVQNLKPGSVLCGGVGSGKSITAIAYYVKSTGCRKDLYIITTAKKRDSLEWEKDLNYFLLSPGSIFYEGLSVIIDSWNNIKKYKKVEDAFFIFDEQRVCGSGSWVKTFLSISKRNTWILLSATPGDVWTDYIPVFIANGFYRTRSEFLDEHAVFRRGSPYPQIEKFIGTKKLERYRDSILVKMDYSTPAVVNTNLVLVDYPRDMYHLVRKSRVDPFHGNVPIRNASGLCFTLRQIINKSSSRIVKVMDLWNEHPKVIIFYNFDYELDILRKTAEVCDKKYAEWNGHKHEPVPDGENWAYFVQYTSGCEGWSCVQTDTIIFFSQNYSYKVMSQAAGRIDRLNTPYNILNYYILRSNAPIDLAITRALKNKKVFNESRFVAKS